VCVGERARARAREKKRERERESVCARKHTVVPGFGLHENTCVY
jgi:hypothetical protein